MITLIISHLGIVSVIFIASVIALAILVMITGHQPEARVTTHIHIPHASQPRPLELNSEEAYTLAVEINDMNDAELQDLCDRVKRRFGTEISLEEARTWVTQFLRDPTIASTILT